MTKAIGVIKNEQLPSVVAKIDALAELEENWDSYSAAPIDPRSIINARRLAAWLASGGVGLVPIAFGTVERYLAS